MVVDIITAAMPAYIGINVAVNPAVRLARTKYRMAVTTMLTMLKIYTIMPDINFMRLVEVQTTSKIKVPITAHDHNTYKTLAHSGNARLSENIIASAAIIIAIPNRV